MINEIIKGLEFLVNLFGKVKEDKRAYDNQEVAKSLLWLYFNSQELLKSGNAAYDKGTIALNTKNEDDLRDFTRQFFDFRVRFENLIVGPAQKEMTFREWSDVMDLFALLDIYVPEFMKKFSRATKDSHGYLIRMPLITFADDLIEITQLDNYRQPRNHKEFVRNMEYRLDLEEEFFNRVTVSELDDFYSKLEVVLSDMAESLSTLKLSLDQLRDFIAKEYSFKEFSSQAIKSSYLGFDLS